ncbi:hypothetical protein N184_32750 [Sinorhizobium sp. GL28]|nr:hypothetical protein N184_32750 [Sinorhizobium sp. GL28]
MNNVYSLHIKVVFTELTYPLMMKLWVIMHLAIQFNLLNLVVNVLFFYG